MKIVSTNISKLRTFDPIVPFFLVGLLDYPERGLHHHQFSNCLDSYVAHKLDDQSDLPAYELGISYDYLFTKKDASNILMMIHEYIPSLELILIYCQAGLSRSTALARALQFVLSRWTGKRPTLYLPHDTYNKHIYDIMIETAFELESEYTISKISI